MARNQEKAQSMLYRFREAQASSFGLTPKTTRRPRLASSVTSLKECERWRGDVLREISGKVSKIQDFGLTDYEVRDLNDEINKLLREKTHWENQILALGGANYKRAVPSMGGDEGVGKRGGYKYFGRAKDLPGVKELFTTHKGEEEGRRSERYERFKGLEPGYYGDEDEDDGLLLEEEGRAEEVEWNGRFLSVVQGLRNDLRRRDGQDENMDISDDDESSIGGIEIPSIPRPSPKPWKESMQSLAQSYSTAYTQPEEQPSTEDTSSSKRPPQAEAEEETPSKRQKGDQGQAIPPAAPAPTASYSIFTPEDLQHPTVPDRAAVEKLILKAKKKQLRDEYNGA